MRENDFLNQWNRSPVVRLFQFLLLKPSSVSSSGFSFLNSSPHVTSRTFLALLPPALYFQVAYFSSWVTPQDDKSLCSFPDLPDTNSLAVRAESDGACAVKEKLFRLWPLCRSSVLLVISEICLAFTLRCRLKSFVWIPQKPRGWEKGRGEAEVRRRRACLWGEKYTVGIESQSEFSSSSRVGPQISELTHSSSSSRTRQRVHFPLCVRAEAAAEFRLMTEVSSEREGSLKSSRYTNTNPNTMICKTS